MNEEQYGLLIESSPDAIVIYDPQGNATYVNPAFEHIFGWSADELLGKRLDFVPEANREETQGFIQAIVQEGRLAPSDTQRYTKDGRIIDIQLSAAATRDENGNIISSIVTLRDVTEHRQAEREREMLYQSEHEQRLLAETLTEVTLALSSQTGLQAVLDEILIQVQRLVPYTTANIALLENNALRVAGWRGYDVIGKEDFVTNLVQPLDKIPLSAQAIQSRKPLVITDTQEHQEAVQYEQTTWIRSYIGMPLALQDKVLGMLRVNSDQPNGFSGQDVVRLTPLAQAAAIALENAHLHEQAQTEIENRKQIEAGLEKRVEKRTAELLHSQTQFSTLIELNPHGIIQWDVDFNVTVWNPGAEQIFGYSAQEAMGQHARFITPEEARPLIEDIWQRVLAQTGGTQSVDENVTKDGRRIICNWYNTPLVNEAGEVTGGASFVEDITERKQAETDLSKRTRLLEILNDLSRQTSFVLDLNPILDTVVQTVTELLDVSSAYISDVNLEAGTTTVLTGYVSDKASPKEKVSDTGTTYDLAKDFGSTAEELQDYGTHIIQHVDDPDLASGERKHMKKYGIQSAITIPLQARNKLIGLLELYESRHKREFMAEELETITAVASQVSVAIDTANLYQQLTRELQERTQIEESLRDNEAKLHRQNQMLLELAKSEAITNGDLKTAFREITEAATRTIAVERASIWQYSADTIVAEDLYILGKNKHSQGMTLMAEEYPLYFEALRTERVIVANDARTHPHTKEFAEGYLEPLGITSMLDASAQLGNETRAILCLEHVGPARQWSLEEQNFANSLTDLLTLAMEAQERKRLEQEVQVSLERRGRELQLLTQMSQEIALAPNIADLYKRLVTIVKEQFGYYHTQILRYNASLDVVELIAGYGEVGEKMLGMHHSMPLGVGLIGKAAATGQSIVSPDVTQEPAWQPNSLLSQTRSELVVPIKLGSRVLGVLDVQSDQPHSLNINDQILLEGLCGQIAVAIESANLRQEMSNRLDELNRLQQLMTREGWQELQESDSLKVDGYLFNKTELRPYTADAMLENGRTNGHHITKTLAIRGAEIGTIGVKDDQGQPLTLEDEEFLTAISEQVAEALEMARLLDTTQNALTKQERLSSELRTVAEVSTVTSTIMERDRLLQNVVDLTKTSFALYHAHIYLLNEGKDTLSLVAGSDQVGRLMTLEESHIPIYANSILTRAARTREPIIVNRTRHATDFLPHPLLPNTRAELAIPMIVGDRLVGVLDVLADVENRFGEQDVLIMRTLASQIAVAVQNAEQYAEQVQTAEKLREVERLKSEFLASMSHELRTPLNSIIGFADVLLEGLDGDLNDRMEQDVRLIRDSGDHLRNLIGDILDMSKIEAGKMDLRYEEIDMRQMAQDIIATANPLAHEKQLKLGLNLSDDLFNIHADRTRLRQIMWNIMGNAIKFTQKGSVTLAMQTQENNLLVSIRDTGIGISSENIPIVFEQFRQIDGSLNRMAEGTGLGMPITKKLVEIHGGEIWVESIIGIGTTFWFTIPRFPAPQTGTGPLPNVD
jgi:PAS domain S-box-containing protein